MNRTVGRWWKPSMGVARKFKLYRHHFGERKKFHLHVRQIEFFVCLFFAAFFFFFFLPSHQICLSHPHSVCGFATNGCRTNAILCCYQRLLLCFFLHVLSKSWTKTNTNPNQNKQKKARFVHFSFFFGPFLPCLLSFLIRVLSHLSPSANAHHPWVCGVQPIQPSGLQQLQAGRKPRRKQQGNGRIHAKQRNPGYC